MEGKVFKRKRVVSLLLALCMALTLLPGTAWAEEENLAPDPQSGLTQVPYSEYLDDLFSLRQYEYVTGETKSMVIFTVAAPRDTPFSNAANNRDNWTVTHGSKAPTQVDVYFPRVVSEGQYVDDYSRLDFHVSFDQQPDNNVPLTIQAKPEVFNNNLTSQSITIPLTTLQRAAESVQFVQNEGGGMPSAITWEHPKDAGDLPEKFGVNISAKSGSRSSYYRDNVDSSTLSKTIKDDGTTVCTYTMDATDWPKDGMGDDTYTISITYLKPDKSGFNYQNYAETFAHVDLTGTGTLLDPIYLRSGTTPSQPQAGSDFYLYICTRACAFGEQAAQNPENWTFRLDGDRELKVKNVPYPIGVTNGGHDLSICLSLPENVTAGEHTLSIKPTAAVFETGGITEDRIKTLEAVINVESDYMGTDPDPAPEPGTRTLSSIAVTTPPAKTSYQVNETFDKTGMVVTATYSDNTTAAVTDYTLSIGENAFTTAGETTITVTCQGKTASFQVNVTESSGSETITIKPTVTATPTRFDVGTTEVKVTLKSTDASFALHLDENMFIVDSGSTRLFLVSVAPARNPGNDGTVWCDAVLTFTDTSAFGGQGPAQAGELKITAKGSAFRSPNAATVMEDAAPVTITIGSSTSGGDNPPVNPNPPVIPDIPFIPSNPSAGNSGGSSNTTAKPSTPPDTVTNPDGSTTTTKTDNATGTVTETTKETDGSLTVVETKTNGTVTTTATDPAGNKTATVENPNGSTVTIIENKDGGASTTTVSTSGQVTAVVTAPAAAVAAAQSGGQAVALPMPEVPLTANTAAAPVVTVTTGSSQPVKVEIPVERTTPGTVAVIVNANGTETVVKTSLASGNGVTLTVPDGATVKIVDNSKSFADTVSHWAGDAITFATAHELFNGTGADSFTPNGTMTRGMLVTVLARYDGVDTASGATWYEKGVEWAAANNISSGADLDAPVSREQLATMLYRYAAFSGLDTAASGALTGFADAGSVSGYAADAMAWAVGMGLIGGTDKGELDPKGSATRAEVAAILMRFCENVMK